MPGITLTQAQQDSLRSYAEQYGVDPNVAIAVAQVESHGDNSLVSPKGAVGIMQMLPSTFYSLTDSNGHPFTNINDPQQNMEAGVVYLSQLNDKYHGNWPTTLAAYNAGEGNVHKYGGIPPFNETQNYVRKVSYLAATNGSTSDSVKSQNVQKALNSAGAANAPALDAQPFFDDNPIAIEPVVTQLQIDDGLDRTPWWEDPNAVTGNRRIQAQVQPISFKIYLNRQTGELLHNPKTNKPVELRLNCSLQSLEIQSKHVVNRQPSRTGQHLTFWGMQPDLINGQGTTGVFMNQFGLTDFFSVAEINDDIRELITKGFIHSFAPASTLSGAPAESTGDVTTTTVALANSDPTDLSFANNVFTKTQHAPASAFRVAAQDIFVEFLKMFQMNGNVYFYNPNYSNYHTGTEQSTPTGWSPQTGLTQLQQNARNNDVFSRGYIAMEFKNNVYLGYFKSLNWIMDAESPFQWKFNFVFQVERTFTTLYVPSAKGIVADSPISPPLNITDGGVNA